MLKLFKTTLVYRFTEAASAYTLLRGYAGFGKLILIEVLNKLTSRLMLLKMKKYQGV
ncbi:hypothetical protein JCM14469_43650 [Desulfatiferula olefinivorans]